MTDTTLTGYVERTDNGTVGTITRFATLIGLALPAAGGFNRFLAYWFEGGIPIHFAAAASLPELAVFGLSGVFSSALGATLVYALVRFLEWGRSGSTGTAAARPRWQMMLDRTVLVVASIGLVVLAVTSPVASLVGAAGSLLAGAWLGRLAASGRTRFGDVLPVAILVFVTATVGTGLFPPPGRAVYLTVEDHASLPADGWFDVFGQGDGYVYARSCIPGSPAVAVRTTSVVGQQFAATLGDRPASPGVIDFLLGARPRLGYVSGCIGVPTVTSP